MTNTNELNKKKRPSSLIKNNQIEPKVQSVIKTEQVEKFVRADKKATVKNQNANLKLSQDTKNELDLLIKLTDHKFGYEMVETLIDYYVENALDNDKKRAFKTLSSI
ncbi:hypothetical protein CKN99_11720 [Carnobacterium maltaromaticum]|jgi:hypothetical protein|uniref:hypothetical protein n=1 Tax=Carnobacterium TaxID=2747 RepID=UPI000E7509AB|nr:hypothetical protein [Carnobacterium maltaromaticum]AOA04206.1 hypothetical protein BFC23_16195 [Carnobacterium maltaromaticum]MDT1946555.1 hypothetical protein [Carnobacterium maltaromaticum]MDT2000940.1 hypothetical protein [Carnobacterium maltaromaticum]MDW5525161.1 hypothetical protein [Carnobacterium maltaromaticum]TFJ25643.1 hypothetical protein CKN90_11675 [Carnobacterium maltaromaticum]